MDDKRPIIIAILITLICIAIAVGIITRGVEITQAHRQETINEILK